MKTVKLNSYAKVNIGLKLLQKRIDGYHDISTVFQEIDLYDEITISRSSNSSLEFSSNVDWLKNDQHNLCVIAYNRIKDLYDIGGVDITAIADEINKLDDITPGAVVAGKAVIVDEQSDVTGFNNVGITGKLTTGTINLGGTDVTASAADINLLKDVTAGIISGGRAVSVDNSNNVSGFNNKISDPLDLSIA